MTRAPHGPIKEIPFASIRRVGVKRDEPCVLCVQTLAREYFFRLNTPHAVEELAAMLCAAAAHAASVPAPAETQGTDRV